MSCRRLPFLTALCLIGAFSSGCSEDPTPQDGGPPPVDSGTPPDDGGPPDAGPPKSKVGEPCTGPSTCEGEICVNGSWCSQDCLNTSCPTGSQCKTTTALGDICIPDGKIGLKAYGDTCAESYECGGTSDTCYDVGGGLVCTKDCTASPTSCPGVQVCRSLGSFHDRRCGPGVAEGGACQIEDDCLNGAGCIGFGGDLLLCAQTCPSGTGCGGTSTCVDATGVAVDTKLEVWDATASLGSNDDWSVAYSFSKIAAWAPAAAGTYYAKVTPYDISQGPYVLRVVPAGTTPTLTPIAEVEPNDDQLTTAQALGAVPASVSATIEAAGADWFSFTVSDTAALDLETMAQPMKACVPNTVYHSKALGADCKANLECVSDQCATWDGSTICRAPCTTTCDTGLECYDSGAGKFCVPEGAKDQAFTFSCALNTDCVAGLSCLKGTCTKICGADGECPAQAFPPAPSSKLCSACAADAECTDGATLGYCVAIDAQETGNYETFCTTDCATSKTCPTTDYACMALDQAETVFGCVPKHFSCRRALCQPDTTVGSSICKVPPLDRGMACTAATECAGSATAAGICDTGMCTRACTSSPDTCGCPNGDITCTNGQCKPAGRETEPNPLISNATDLGTLGATPIKAFGILLPAGSTNDVDIFKLTLGANATIDAITTAPCTFVSAALDNNIRILDSTGTLVPGADNDDLDANVNYFAGLTGQVLVAGTYYIEITGTPALPDIQLGSYVLTLTKQ